MDTPKYQLLNSFISGAYFFDIRYLRETYFDVVWGTAPPQGPPQIDPPIINFFLISSSLGNSFFFDINTYQTKEYFDIALGCHPPGTCPKWTPQN